MFGISSIKCQSLNIWQEFSSSLFTDEIIKAVNKYIVPQLEVQSLHSRPGTTRAVLMYIGGVYQYNDTFFCPVLFVCIILIYLVLCYNNELY